MDSTNRRAEIFKAILEGLAMENQWDVIARLEDQLDPQKKCTVQENDSVLYKNIES